MFSFVSHELREHRCCRPNRFALFSDTVHLLIIFTVTTAMTLGNRENTATAHLSPRNSNGDISASHRTTEFAQFENVQHLVTFLGVRTYS